MEGLRFEPHYICLESIVFAFNQGLENFLQSEVKVTQLCPTFCDPTDYTVHGIFQARILEWVAFSFSRGSSQPRDQTHISRIADGFFTSWATREAHFCKGQMVTISVFARNMGSLSHHLLSFTTLYKSESHFELTNHTKSGWWAWYGLASVCSRSLLTSAFNQCTHCFSGCENSVFPVENSEKNGEILGEAAGWQ